MAKVIIKGTEKVALNKVGDNTLTMEQAEARAESMNKEAKKLDIKTRYEAKA